MKISIVSPIYLGEKLVLELVTRLNDTLPKLTDDYEIILVEDGSPDKSWEAIQMICGEQEKVKGIKLSRNFGQHYAITCGLKEAKGEWVVIMDCDLQDKPEEIPKLFHKAQEGYDIVFAKRKERKDKFFKKLSSKLFYSVLGYLTDTKQDSSIANFGIYHCKVIDAVSSMKDSVRYFPTLVQWVGFNKTKIDVVHASRSEGESSYSWGKLLNLAFDNIIAFSNKPLKLVVKLGFIISMISFILGLIYLYQYLIGNIVVLGFSSIIISITFLSGLIILTLGVIGVYLGKTFEQVKQRPNYIIHKKLNMNN